MAYGIFVMLCTIAVLLGITHLMYWVARWETDLRDTMCDGSYSDLARFLAFCFWIPIGILKVFFMLLSVISFGYLMHRAAEREE